MNSVIGNLLSLFSVVGMLLVTLMLSIPIIFFGVELVNFAMGKWNFYNVAQAIGDLIALGFWIWVAFVWITRGLEKWVEKDHVIQKALFVRVY